MSVTRRATGFEVVVELGRDHATGKRVRKSETVRFRDYRTERQAEQAALKLEGRFLEDRDAGVKLKKGDQAFGAYLKAWLEDVEAARAYNTYRQYERAVRLYIEPVLGKVPLKKLTADDLASLYRETAKRQKSGYHARHGLVSPSTIRAIHTACSAALTDAYELGYIAHNPAVRARRYAPRVERRRMPTLDRQQTNALLRAVEAADDVEADLVGFLVLTGLRKGEAMGLRWEGVGAATCAVWRPKTHSWQVIPLVPQAQPLLRRVKARQNAARLRWGPDWLDSGLVFTDEIGRPLTPSTVNRRLKSLLSSAALPPIRVHDLRHTFASLQLLGARASVKVVQELMGHSSSRVTLDTYSHVIPTQLEEAAAAFGAYLAAEG